MPHLWRILILIPSLANADPAPQAPGVTVVVAAAPAPAPTPGPSAFPLEENQTNGFYLGLRGGLVDADRSNLGVGVAPKYRFARFFALEGTGMFGIHHLKKRSGSTQATDLSAFATAQLTFHSVLFSFTPKLGLGYLAQKRESFDYAGPALRLGLEVEVGRMILSGELTSALNSSSPNLRYGPNSYDYSYPYDYYPQEREEAPATLELGLAFRVSEKDRLGFRLSGPTRGSRGLTQHYLFYEIGL